MSFRRFFLCVITLLSGIYANAQHILTREGTYQYIASENQSISEARRIALQRAQIQILADEYGTVVSQTTSTRTVNSSEASDVDFTSVGISDVRGEWIETVGEPHYEQSFSENGLLVIKVTVKGRIRELHRAEVTFKARLLRDGITPSCETDDFHSGNSLYASFQSPSSGYLSIYLISDSRAFCLFPYNGDEDGACEFRQNREYILFCKDRPEPFQKDLVQEVQMTCGTDYETNIVYFIFSPHKYVKAIDSQKEDASLGENLMLPRELPEHDFIEWLAKNRAHDKDMQVDRRMITVKR